MQIKSGVDIIEVDRIEKAIKTQGDKFLQKVYTKNEIEYCSNSGQMMYQHYAARFAAKEAIFKAISEEILPLQEDIWTKIEIKNTESGKPFADLTKLNIANVESTDLSISHIKEYAIATFSVLFK